MSRTCGQLVRVVEKIEREDLRSGSASSTVCLNGPRSTTRLRFSCASFKRETKCKTTQLRKINIMTIYLTLYKDGKINSSI